MKCAAKTIRNGQTITCASQVPHVDHWGDAFGEIARWRSPAELDEGVRSINTRTNPNKVEWSQLAPFLPALELVARALMHGAKKHHEAPGSTAWRDVEDPAHVFGNKIARHGLEHACGRKFDPESKLPHLAHLIANALIVMMSEGDFIK